MASYIVLLQVVTVCCSCQLCILLLRHKRRQCRPADSYHRLKTINQEAVDRFSMQDQANEPAFPPTPPAYSSRDGGYYPASHPV